MPSFHASIWQKNLNTVAALCRAIASNDTILVFTCLTNLASKTRQDADLSAFARYLETAELSETRIEQCLKMQQLLNPASAAVLPNQPQPDHDLITLLPLDPPSPDSLK